MEKNGGNKRGTNRVSAKRRMQALGLVYILLLTGIAVWCLLSCIPWAAASLLLSPLFSSHNVGIIGSQDGPTAILVATADPMFPSWFYFLVQAAALVLCVVLAVRVRRVERRLQ